MKIKSYYHNEIIALIAIEKVLEHCESISPAQSALILPFLFHKETLNFFCEEKPVSINEIVQKKSILLADFNERYYSLLPISINAITLGKAFKRIEIIDNKIALAPNYTSTQGDIDSIIRVKKIKVAAEAVANIFKTENANSLYFILKISI